MQNTLVNVRIISTSVGVLRFYTNERLFKKKLYNIQHLGKVLDGDYQVRSKSELSFTPSIAKL